MLQNWMDLQDLLSDVPRRNPKEILKINTPFTFDQKMNMIRHNRLFVNANPKSFRRLRQDFFNQGAVPQ